MKYKKLILFILNIKIIDELNNNSEQGNQEAKLSEYNEEVTKLWEKLMSLEVLVVDQLEVKKFEFIYLKIKIINFNLI